MAVEHERKILWVKGEYWVMTDYLNGEGSHKIEQVFHFSPLVKSRSAEGIDPGEVILEGNTVAVSRNPGVANLAVMQVGGSDLRVRKDRGAKDPHVGWTALYGENPVWDVTFQAQRTLPTALTVVLYPLKPGENSIPILRTIRQDAEAAVFDIAFEDHTDRIILAVSREASIDFHGIHFEGEVLILRKVAGGEFEPLLHEGGKRLVLQGVEVALIENK